VRLAAWRPPFQPSSIIQKTYHFNLLQEYAENEKVDATTTRHSKPGRDNHPFRFPATPRTDGVEAATNIGPEVEYPAGTTSGAPATLKLFTTIKAC
jgi:hypothetical protein